MSREILDFKNLDQLGVEKNLDQSSLKHNYLNYYEEYFKNKIGKVLIVGDSEISYEMAKIFTDYFKNLEVFYLSRKNHSNHQNLNIINYIDVKKLAISIAQLKNIISIIDHSENNFKNKNDHFFSLFPILPPNSDYFIEDIHACFMDKFKNDNKSIYENIIEINNSKLKNTKDDKIIFFEKLVLSIELLGKLLKVKRSNILALIRLQENNYEEFNKINNISKNIIIHEEYKYNTNCQLKLNRNNYRDNMPNIISVPQMKLRIYNNVTCIPGQILIKENIILPEHQRRNIKPGHKNKNIKKIHDLFAIHDFKISETLHGDYLYFDNEYNEHFGHIIVEQISKLWAWDEFKKIYPQGKILVGGIEGKINNILLNILLAYGINPDEIQLFTQPVKIENLVCPSQQYQIGYYADKKIEITWDRLKNVFIRNSNIQTYEKIFIGRPKDSDRGCKNAEVVEKYFIKKGYNIIQPEEYKFADQVKLFSEATHIAGYGGSGTLNSIFSKKDIVKTIIKSESYDANNDYLISSVKGGKLNICFCDADIKHDKNWNVKAFMSNYQFNQDKDSIFLEENI